MKYYVVTERAMPEALLKVVEAKRLLDANHEMTVQEAAAEVDISRSSFYKYRDDVFPFHEGNKGKTINVMMQLEDVPGVLSKVLDKIAKNQANLLTVNQSIPIGGIATITLGIEILPVTVEVNEMLNSVAEIEGVNKLRILGRE